jgi:hypothetical protein
MAENIKNNELDLEEQDAQLKGAEKGDKVHPKQGSSDAEKIEKGKSEVVTPDENPVDKAVASVKKASDNKKSPKRKGDQDGGDKVAAKVSEDVDTEEDSIEEGYSKVEMIKAMVNKFKDMDKEQLKASYDKMVDKQDDDEEDDMEESTKAEIIRAIAEHLKYADEESVAEQFDLIINEAKAKEEKEDDSDDEEEDEDEDEMDEEVQKELEDAIKEVEVNEDVEALAKSLNLDEENKAKAQTIFESAVAVKVDQIKKDLTEQYSKEHQTAVEESKSALSEQVDKYLSYVAEEWVKENELAIERGLKSEMTENFITGLKALFVEHYVEVPEEKYDVMDELANRLDEMEDKLNSEVERNMKLQEEIDGFQRESVVNEACADLSEAQKEKLLSLSGKVDFQDKEDFVSKISEIKEAYFPTEKTEDTLIESAAEGEDEWTDTVVESTDKVVDPTMAKYAEFVSKVKPLNSK